MTNAAESQQSPAGESLSNIVVIYSTLWLSAYEILILKFTLQSFKLIVGDN